MAYDAGTLFEVGSWNIHGCDIFNFGDWSGLIGEGWDAVALQEVGGLGSVPSRPMGELNEYLLPEESDLHDFFVLGTSDLDSYLGQVIVVDKLVCKQVLRTFKGARYIGAQILTMGNPDCQGLPAHQSNRSYGQTKYCLVDSAYR